MWRLAVFLLVALAGCSSRLPTVHLEALEPSIPEVQTPVSGKTLVVAVAGMLSPRASAPYRRLAKTLADDMGVNVLVLQRRTYAEVLDLLKEGTAQVGFLCTLAAGKGVAEGYLRVVTAGVPFDYAPYRSVILTRSDLGVKNFRDLEGRRFAFVDPLSNTGYAWPKRYFRSKGIVPETFFKQTIFTYSHDRSIRALLEGFVDAAAVDGIVYYGLAKEDPVLKTKLRVLWESPDNPPPPVVIRADLPPETSAKLTKALTTLDVSVLAPLHIARFEPSGSEPYRLIWRQFVEEGDEAL